MTNVDGRLWQQIIQHVVAHAGGLIRPWFDRLEPVALDHGLLEIRVPGPQEQRYCVERCAPLFTEAAQLATGRLVSISFLAPPGQELRAEPELRLNPDCTFESFVTGPCNRFAHAACVAVSESPGRTYNPLFIYGSSGLGKTHLLQAICHTVMMRGQTNIAFLSCETFVNHLIESIERKSYHDFRYRYRNCDLLVIDDVQFLSNHEQTQEEFFHTFNTLYQAQRQIILSCDRPPAEIPKLEERLISRFNWGLVTGLDRPTYETRVAIVRKKAAARNVELPDDVISFIAGTIDSNARELEGAITKIAMLAQVLDREIELGLAEEAMGSEAPHRREVTIDQIIEIVCKRYGVRVTDLQSKKRSRSIALPRQVCMYLARALTNHSLGEIGGYFGGRDHTTVLHANRTIDGLRKTDPTVRTILDQLIQELRQLRR